MNNTIETQFGNILGKRTIESEFGNILGKNNIKEIEEFYHKHPNLNLEYDNCCFIRESIENECLDTVSWLYPKGNWTIKIEEKFNDEYPDEDLVCFCCRYGYLSTLKLLYKLDKNIDFSQKTEEPFNLAGQEGHLNVMIWLQHIKPSIDIHSQDNFVFKVACIRGYLDIVKWMYSLNKTIFYVEFIDGKLIDWKIKDSNYFSILCRNGELEKAKELYDTIEDINISVANERPFYNACKYGHLDIAKWLYTINPIIDIWLSQNSSPFQNACQFGHLELAKWLYSIKLTIDISAENEHSFRSACENGYLEIAKWLYTIKSTIDISILEDSAFCNACEHGHLDIAKWLYSIKNDIDFSTKDEYAFRYSCQNGYLEVAKWLYTIKSDIDISSENEYAFRYSCQNGYLEVAEWLYSIKSDIQITAENDFAFREACNYWQNDIAEWITTLRPDKYFIVIEENLIIDWYIIKKLEIHGEKTIDKVKNCPVCYDKSSNIITSCDHQFCVECIQEWYCRSFSKLTNVSDVSCPYCREKKLKFYKIIN